MHRTISVGLYDWVKFPAKNNFYPQDLPVDWKLSFYANEFETACITLNDSLDFSILREWVEDLADNFQLSFKLTSIDRLDLLDKLTQAGRLKINFLIVEPQERDILLHNNSTKTVLLKAGTSHSGQIVSAASIWTPDNLVESSTVAMLPDIDDKRLYRQWIELWLDDNSQQNLTLWLDGASARYSTLSDLRTLVELMGY